MYSVRSSASLRRLVGATWANGAAEVPCLLFVDCLPGMIRQWVVACEGYGAMSTGMLELLATWAALHMALLAADPSTLVVRGGLVVRRWVAGLIPRSWCTSWCGVLAAVVDQEAGPVSEVVDPSGDDGHGKFFVGQVSLRQSRVKSRGGGMPLRTP